MPDSSLRAVDHKNDGSFIRNDVFAVARNQMWIHLGLEGFSELEQQGQDFQCMTRLALRLPA